MQKIFRIDSKYTKWDMVQYSFCALGNLWRIIAIVIAVILAAAWGALLLGFYVGGGLSLAMQMVLIGVIWVLLPVFSGFRLFKRMKKSRTGIQKIITGYMDKIVAENLTTGEMITCMTQDIHVENVYKKFLRLKVNNQLLIIKRDDFTEGTAEDVLGLYGVESMSLSR